MARKLRFAIIGCGVIGEHHAKEIAALTESAELVAAADIYESNAQKIAAAYQVDVYTDYHEMLKREDIDVVNICTPSGMHGEAAIACAHNGKHCIVEKPMEIQLQRMDEMIAAFNKANVKMSVISQHRFDAATIEIKREIAEGKFGKMILGTAAVNWYRSQAYYDSGAWRGTWALDGGGALMNQSIHTIDLLQYLVGPVESVHAQTATLGHGNIEVEDVAVATLKFKNGALGTIVGTTCAYPGLSARVEIFAEKGTAVIDGDALMYKKFKETEDKANFYGTVEITEEEKKAVAASGSDPRSALNNAHRTQFEDMIAAIHENREPQINGIEGRAPVEIILAIYESAKTGKTIQLPYQY